MTQVEAGTRLSKMSFICVRIKNDFHINAFALSLALKQTLGATQKLPFVNECKKRAEGVTHEVPLFSLANLLINLQPLWQRDSKQDLN